MKKLKNNIYIFIIICIFLLVFCIIKVGDMVYMLYNTKDIKNDKSINKKIDINNNKTDNNIKIIDGILIVNKTYSLPSNYVPKNTKCSLDGIEYSKECIDSDTYNNFIIMKKDANKEGLNIWIQSGYRSYNYQDKLYNYYLNIDGKNIADTYSARAGHSEHQTGLAIDLNTIDNSFQYTNEYKWIYDNCYKYGFILRYPKDKEKITGYKYESWHLRYVGKKLSYKLYNNGNWITLEEYFNIDSRY